MADPIKPFNVTFNTQQPKKASSLISLKFECSSQEGKTHKYSCSVSNAFVYGLVFNLNKYSTEDSPNITQKEWIDAQENIIKTTGDLSGGASTNFDEFDFLLLDRFEKMYTNDESDGGKEITPVEMDKIVQLLESLKIIKKEK